MSLVKLKSILDKISQLSESSKDRAKITGENFNIFRTLKLDSLEVRTHSAFLAEFLDPKGSHDQGNIYLKLFVEQFNITEFDLESAVVEIEKYTGNISSDYTEGGRIDILISDANKKNIIIENKIYADDQEKQLLRYHNFDSDAPLFYLTLDGSEPSKKSISDELTQEHYRVISYKFDIIEWLTKCLHQSLSLPTIRETLVQYINLIKYLTNQVDTYMNETIKKFLLENQDCLQALDECNSVLESITDETFKLFKKAMDIKFEKNEILISGDITIKVKWGGENSKTVWFGYQAFNSKEGNISSSDPIRERFSSLIKNHNNFHTEKDWIMWFNPKEFENYKKFKDLDKSKILSLYNNKSALDSFVDTLISQEREVRSLIAEKIEST